MGSDFIPDALGTIFAGPAYWSSKAAAKGAAKVADEAIFKPQREAAAEAAKPVQAALDRQNQLLADQKADQDQAKLDEEATATRNAARSRQRQKAAGAGGISSTILTSPLGLSGNAGFSGKTLLGE